MQHLLTRSRWRSLLLAAVGTLSVGAQAAGVEQLAAEVADLQRATQQQARAIAQAAQQAAPRSAPAAWWPAVLLLLAGGGLGANLWRQGRGAAPPRAVVHGSLWPPASGRADAVDDDDAAPSGHEAGDAREPAPPGCLPSAREQLDELQALLEQHDLLASIGHHAQAAQLLAQACDGPLGDSAVPWLAWLALARAQGDAAAGAQAWQGLLQRLGPVGAEALDDPQAPFAALESAPGVLRAVQAAWGGDRCDAVLHAALFGRLAARHLSLAAAQELLWLAQVRQADTDRPVPTDGDDAWWRVLDSAEMPTRPGIGVDGDLGAWEAHEVAARTVRQASVAAPPVAAAAAVAAPSPARAEAAQDAFDAVMQFERSRPAPVDAGRW